MPLVMNNLILNLIGREKLRNLGKTLKKLHFDFYTNFQTNFLSLGRGRGMSMLCLRITPTRILPVSFLRPINYKEEQ